MRPFSSGALEYSRSVNGCSLGFIISDINNKKHKKPPEKTGNFPSTYDLYVLDRKTNSQRIIKGRVRETRY